MRQDALTLPAMRAPSLSLKGEGQKRKSPSLFRERVGVKVFIACILLAISFPAYATGQKPTPGATPKILPDPGSPKKAAPKEPFVYAPENCDFQVTFPDAPVKNRRCPEGPGRPCYDLTSYTMVYDLSTTVDVSVTCNASVGVDNFERYNENVMRAALEGMIDRRHIENYEIGFQQYETVRSATLTGSGKSGRQEKIYTAQIWVGPKSVFTMQAELVGGAHPKADAVFRDILQSLEVQGVKETPTTEEDEEDE